MTSPVIKTTRIGILDALFCQEVEYYWAREPSSIRVRGLGSGHFSGPSSARGAMFRSVFASRASEGQGEVGSGAEPDGRGSRPEIRPFEVDRMAAR